MEDVENGSKLKKSTWQGIKKGVFNTFTKMLKAREVNRVTAALLMAFAFLQIYGTVLTNTEHINWKDDIASGFIWNLFDIIRVSPIIIRHKAFIFYWFFYSICSFF